MDKQILVVDDVDDDARTMEDIIERIMGLTTIVAADGAEAMGLALQNRPDLILMDLKLSPVSGWEVVSDLRQMEEFREIPIIAVTSYDGEILGLRDRALAAGCNAYITKPLDIDAFIEVVNSYLS